MYYHKSKKLNVSALNSLEKNPKFNDIEVDTSVSTVHVPTHVYDECKAYLSQLLNMCMAKCYISKIKKMIQLSVTLKRSFYE